MTLTLLANLMTLILLELALGVDNLVFISLVLSRLPKNQRDKTRKLGVIFAVVTRLLLLVVLFWASKKVYPLFTAFGETFSLRDTIFLLGGIFLIVKSTQEIHGVFHRKEEEQEIADFVKGRLTFAVIQIMIFDIVFSLDSVITAVGISQDLWVMVTAIVIAMLCMLYASKRLCEFLEHYPSLKVLALAFLLCIGAILICDAFHFYVPREYLFAAIGLSVVVEIVNILRGKRVQH